MNLRAVVLAAGVLACAGASAREVDPLDDATAWRALASDQVGATLSATTSDGRRAVCLDYDFNGVSGHAGLRRALPLAWPENFRIDLAVRGDGPRNALQFKLVSADGDDVWWVNRPRFDWPRGWTLQRWKRREVTKAWGPGKDPTLRSSAAIELVVYSEVGGRGRVCFDELSVTPIPPDDHGPLVLRAGPTASAAVDGDPDSAAAVPAGEPGLPFDFGRSREFGGLVLDWAPGAHPTDYDVEASDDGQAWRLLRAVRAGTGRRDWLATPDAEARWIRVIARSGTSSTALTAIRAMPLAFAQSPNAFVAEVARDLPRGHLPRAFNGEQSYWTIVGIDGGAEQGLLGEDGALESARGGFRVEPFVRIDGHWLSWADVRAEASLVDGELPMPGVRWQHPKFELTIDAFAAGEPGRSRLFGRYRLSPRGDAAMRVELALAVRPFQVNPPSQFLNTTGGVSRIERLAIEGGSVRIDGRERLRALTRPGRAFATRFDSGFEIQRLTDGNASARTVVEDPTGLASGALLYGATLAPGESLGVDLVLPLEGEFDASDASIDVDARQRAVADDWRARLHGVAIELPGEGRAIAAAIRTALAHLLISRKGPRLQPGTRSYARAWIRDGAMIGEGLLRLGRDDVAREFVEWYAPFQFRDGKVPCCVDDRGSDPVVENDSHGQLIYAIADVWRHTGDRELLQRLWPRVEAAIAHMDRLRASQRTNAIRAATPAHFGLLPASISHEGYSAKPMHSYWDDFWGLRGYVDALAIAQALGRASDAARIESALAQFRGDIHASLTEARKLHGIDHLPGAAELGDFDPTSSTIALAPGGEQARLPPDVLSATWERYWREFAQRRDGTRAWKDYTPYEWRNVGAMLRLGWRERAWSATRWLFDARTPQAWNQWAEVVSRTPREPFFLGDLPHAWVASDFLRAALDLLAYTEFGDRPGLVLAAGVPVEWLDEGIALRGLRTAWGPLGYRLQQRDGVLRLTLDAGLRTPPGGIRLAWPYGSGQAPGRTTIDGEVAAWDDGMLAIPHAPAIIETVVDPPTHGS
jgi:hypothetical protein